MKTGAAQLEIEAVEAQELEAIGDSHAIVLERVFAACRKVVRELTADVVARELDVMWANRGRPVTAPVLRSALADSRGNYFRFEWILWFAEHSDEVRELLIGIGVGRSEKEP